MGQPESWTKSSWSKTPASAWTSLSIRLSQMSEESQSHHVRNSDQKLLTYRRCFNANKLNLFTRTEDFLLPLSLIPPSSKSVAPHTMASYWKNCKTSWNAKAPSKANISEPSPLAFIRFLVLQMVNHVKMKRRWLPNLLQAPPLEVTVKSLNKERLTLT